MKTSSDLAARSSGRIDDLVDELTDLFRRGEFDAIERLMDDHPAHAGRLRGLLPALALMGELGEPSASSLDGPPPGPDPAGGPGVLGDFRIVREVGRGGMGVVYEAVQISLGRRVALKVLPFAAAMDPQHLARFRVEVQAAALLHHAHIVPIHAVGCDRGVHYYAMQYIDGRTLAGLIDEVGRGPARPRGLARTAATLGLQAAEALEHAHRLGVIHRDVKPANLLIDPAGKLWVADFGLARLGDDAGPTRSDHVVGTLRYMPPEQALGRRVVADGRADVYALGVTLYELLTGRPAFGGGGRQAVLHQVAFEEPRSPRSIEPSIPRDLETIVLKAMSKEPEARYPTAQGLADDLRQFLEDRPIRARRLSPLGRVARRARRHRAILTTAALTLLAACSLASTLLWRENLRTREALRQAETARAREREALLLTFAGSDLIASRALRKIAASSAPIDGPDAAFCRRALVYYEQLGTRYNGDPALEALVASAEHRVGFLRRLLGLGDAEPHLVRALRLWEGAAASRPGDPEAWKSLSSVLDDLAAQVEADRGPDAASSARGRALEVRRELALRFPEVPDYRLSVALTVAYGIGPLIDRGRLAEADSARGELTRSTDEALGLAATDSSHRNELAWLMASRPGASAATYRRAAELARGAIAIAPGDTRLWNTLGVACYRAGDDREAIRALDRSLQIRDGGDPYDWLFLALAELRSGDRARARALLDRSASWIASHDVRDPDLGRFQREAAGAFAD